jgi:hypothetical protein
MKQPFMLVALQPFDFERFPIFTVHAFNESFESPLLDLPVSPPRFFRVGTGWALTTYSANLVILENEIPQSSQVMS